MLPTRWTLIATLLLAATAFAEDKKDDGFVSLFNGKDLTGWKNNEDAKAVRVEDGLLVLNGNRSHLFYVGDDKPFVNFELRAEIMTMPNSNSGVYFHTQYQDTGWPKYGFECQVNNSYKDPQKTASLYGVVPNKDAPAKDNEWFTMTIRVEGKKVVISVDGKKIVDYTEPAGKEAGKDFTRKLDKGTFALQAHDPGSKVLYRKIEVKRLP